MYRGDIRLKLIQDWGFIPPATPLFRREALIKFPMNENYSAEGESIFFKLASRYEFDYVNEFVTVMRGHSYNSGANFQVMYHENIKWWSEYFSSDEVDEIYLERASQIFARLHRMFGLCLLVETADKKTARSALLRSIKYKANNIIDAKILAGIVLASFNNRLFDAILRSRKKTPLTRTY